jgi:hypothetical protein
VREGKLVSDDVKSVLPRVSADSSRLLVEAAEVDLRASSTRRSLTTA